MKRYLTDQFELLFLFQLHIINWMGILNIHTYAILFGIIYFRQQNI